MKTVLSTNPTFTPGTPGTGYLDFTGVSGFSINRLYAVVNITRNAVIYAEGQNGSGLNNWNSGNNRLYPQFDTSSHNSGDLLQCIYDDATVGVNTNSIIVPPTISTGYTNYHHLVTAATTNLTVVKNGPGVIGSMYLNCVNTGAAAPYLKIFDKSTAPILGTDTPKLTISILSNGGYSAYNVLGGSTYQVPPAGLRFLNGISYAVTNAPADTDTTATVAGCIVDIVYV